MAVQINLFIDQGALFVAYATVTNEDGGVFDLNGWLPRGSLRKSFYSSSSTPLIVSVFGDPKEGQLKLVLKPSVSNLMKAGRYVYDVEVEKEGDPENVKRVLQGSATLNPNVTRAG